ncbi:MAG: hypothetical protein JXQ65_06960 [Candidatus Marinimicrobia bacterium]|nr:hypothetical protein [Candidatus Neomarinimicrobiota bacterium]
MNLQHSLSLVDSIEVDGKILSYIWIYADAPDYKGVIAEGEGITCVDDVGRYLEVLEYEIIDNGNLSLIPVAKTMAEFLLYMSREDGLWYNFMFEDGRINETHVNSKAAFEFWALRGLRGLAAGYNIFRDNQEFSKRIKSKIMTMNPHLKEILGNYPKVSEHEFGNKPEWMVKGAADKTNELILALTALHKTGEFDYQDEIEKFSEALVLSQYRNEDSEINGMYFCWNNIWHAWGNSQAFALLEAYKITGNEKLLESVKLWADNFVPFFVENKFPRRITVNNDDFDLEVFPQIAYGINSVYRGIASLAAITEEKNYDRLAEQVFQWYFGQNIVNEMMYDKITGRCYDGINDGQSINRNSGAESTIECLLSMQWRERI